MRIAQDRPDAPEEDLCGGTGCPGHGCWQCCPACNTDTHRCPGCGDQLNHGIGVCLQCRNRKDLP